MVGACARNCQGRTNPVIGDWLISGKLSHGLRFINFQMLLFAYHNRVPKEKISSVFIVFVIIVTHLCATKMLNESTVSGSCGIPSASMMVNLCPSMENWNWAKPEMFITRRR